MKGAAFLALLLLSSCSSPMIAPHTLKPSSLDKTIILSKSISYSKTVGLIPERATFGVAPGVYRPEMENDAGVFFRGEGRSVWVSGQRTGSFISSRSGGIWVPHEMKASPLIYVYFEISPPTSENLNTYLLQHEISQQNLSTPVIASATGNALGMAIIDGIINRDLGKIHFFDSPDDNDFNHLIRSSISMP